MTCVLVFGATGLFGKLLVRRLACKQSYTVVGVARNKSRLNALQTNLGISTAVVDINEEVSVAAALRQWSPFAVVDQREWGEVFLIKSGVEILPILGRAHLFGQYFHGYLHVKSNG